MIVPMFRSIPPFSVYINRVVPTGTLINCIQHVHTHYVTYYPHTLMCMCVPFSSYIRYSIFSIKRTVKFGKEAVLILILCCVVPSSSSNFIHNFQYDAKISARNVPTVHYKPPSFVCIGLQPQPRETNGTI